MNLIEHVPERSAPRHFGVILGGLIAAFSFPAMAISTGDDPPLIIIMLTISLVVGLISGMFKPFLTQLIARATWWQAGFLAVLIVGNQVFGSGGPEREFFFGLTLLAGTSMALASAGRIGLTQSTKNFAPIAFRAGLVISLVMALADAEALLIYGAHALDRGYGEAWPFFVSASVMGVAIWGLYRLKIWAVGLNIAANITIAAMALGGVLDLPNILAGGLAATAIAQLLIPMPMLTRIAGKLLGR